MQKTLFLALLLVLLAAPSNAFGMPWLAGPFAFTDKVAMLIWEPVFGLINRWIGTALCAKLITFIETTAGLSAPADVSYCETAILEYAAYSFFPGAVREADDYNYSWNTNYQRKW